MAAQANKTNCGQVPAATCVVTLGSGPTCINLLHVLECWSKSNGQSRDLEGDVRVSNRVINSAVTCCRAHTDTLTLGRGWPTVCSLFLFHLSTRHAGIHRSSLVDAEHFPRHLKATGTYSIQYCTSLVP